MIINYVKMDIITALETINKSVDDFSIEPLTEEKIATYNKAAKRLGVNKISLITKLKSHGFNSLQDFRESKKVFDKSKLLGELSGIALGTYMAFSLMELIENKTKPFNFKYNIEDKTDMGIIKTRYYEEWKNRHGGDCSGFFYVMENGDSYNEFLINRV